MVDPVFYLMLTPFGLALIAALAVLARGLKRNAMRTVVLALLITGGGALISILFIVGSLALYFAGGGH